MKCAYWHWALGTVHGCIFSRECTVSLLRKILWSMPSPLINAYVWIIIDGKWVLAATEFDLGGDRIIILFPFGASQWIIFVSTVNWHRTFLWVALYGLSTGSYLITEVKSCWAGSISRLVTILVSLCCMPGEVRLGLCSTLVPPTSGSVCGLSFSQSQPGFFSGYSGFPSSLKLTPSQKNIWLRCSAPGS